MTAFENRVIKSKLVDIIKSKGYDVSVTDSSRIVVFTDRPINKNSKKLSKSETFKQPYITSFGTKGALKFIKEYRLGTIITGKF